MGKRLSYLIAQGQGAMRSGISLGIPFQLANYAAANGAIPAASFPIETVIYTVPDRIVADAFNANYMDTNPAANEPNVQVVIEAVRWALNAAFASNAASFSVLLRRLTSAGAVVGTIATIFNGVADTAVANEVRTVAKATLLQQPMNVGDSVTARITVNGGGAACPAFGGILDIQG